MRKYLVGVTEFVLSACILFIIFFYAIAFSVRQSIGLSVLLAFLGWQLRRPNADEKVPFIPFQIRCTPNVFLMLSDLGLVKSGEEFRNQLGPRRSLFPWDGNNVVDYGMYAVFLSDNGEFGARSRSVIHFPWQGRYSTTLNWESRIATIKSAEEILPAFKAWDSWSLDIFMRPGIGGYEIGVRVNEKWWDERKDKIAAIALHPDDIENLPEPCAPSQPHGSVTGSDKDVILRADREFNLGTVCLVLCVLPYQVTSDFFRQFDHYDTREQLEAHKKSIERLVAEQGWEVEGTGNSELGSYGEGYQHRYMQVWIRALDQN